MVVRFSAEESPEGHGMQSAHDHELARYLLGGGDGDDGGVWFELRDLDGGAARCGEHDDELGLDSVLSVVSCIGVYL